MRIAISPTVHAALVAEYKLNHYIDAYRTARAEIRKTQAKAYTASLHPKKEERR